jgi:hypothetical protein
LSQIASVLDGAPGSEQWAEVDVLAVLDVDGPLDGVRDESPWSRRLEMLRTTLIFCPLIITWAGLFFASRAYSSLISTDAVAARQPFLKLWLNGFQGRTVFSLEALALSSALFIALLIAVSVLLERQRQKDDADFDLTTRAKRQELRAGAISAQLSLIRHRFSSPERFREELTRTSATFGHLIQQITYMANAVNVTLSGLGPVAERLQSASQHTSVSAGEIATTTVQISTLIANLEQTLLRASDQVETAVNGGNQQLASQVASAAAVVDRALQQGNQQLTGQVESSASWVVGAAEAILAQSDRAVSASAQTYDEIKRTVSAVHQRIDEALSRDANAAALLQASAEASSQVAATRQVIAELSNAIKSLPPQRSDASEELLLRAAAALETVGSRLTQIANADPNRAGGLPTGYASR